MTVETKSPRKIRRGYGRDDRPLTKELWRNDSMADHPAINSFSDYDPDHQRIDYRRYHSIDYMKREHERLWLKSWVYACREEDLPNIGDRLPVKIGKSVFMIVRSGADKIQAFANQCLHRGTKLCVEKDHVDVIRCPFHGWEWKLDGSLKHIPSHWDFSSVNQNNSKLLKISVGIWGGFVFINADPDAPPLVSALGVVTEHLNDYQFDKRRTVGYLRKEIRANWKLVQEAFQESYHVVTTHPMIVPMTGDSQAAYDVYVDEYSAVGRQISPNAVPSMYASDEHTMFTAANATAYFMQSWHHPEAAMPELNPSGDCRRELAEWRRNLESERIGRPYTLPDAALIDSTLYFTFPQSCFWMSETIPFFYSFTPHETDPGRSYFEVRMLKLMPEDDQSPPAECVHIGPDTQIEGKAPLFGLLQTVFDQDMANLPLVQQGCEGADPRRTYAILGDYQESIIQEWHKRLDRIMGDDS